MKIFEILVFKGLFSQGAKRGNPQQVQQFAPQPAPKPMFRPTEAS
jgi:hypothetical protein